MATIYWSNFASEYLVNLGDSTSFLLTPRLDLIWLTYLKTKSGSHSSNGNFLFYKIVTTTDHSYPKYPDDDTIKTIAYQNETSFIDINPEEGLNYYAVTIVRPDKTRFTSERVSIKIE